MFRFDGRWVYSARDLADAVDCGHRVRLNLAAAAGTLVERPQPNPVMRIAGELGRVHEDAALQRLETDYGMVHRARGARTGDPASVAAAVADTAQAMRDGVPVIAQPVLFDGEFFGRADFLIRVTDRGPARYEAVDAKRSSTPKKAAWVQVASYSEQMVPLGFPAPRQVHLWLPDGVQSKDAADVQPDLDAARVTVRAAIAAGPQPPDPLWADTTSVCDRCDWLYLCQRGREQARHLSLVHNLRRDHRDALTAAGIATIDALAVAPDAARPERGIPEHVFTRARSQARLQVAQDATRTPDNPLGRVTFEVFSDAGFVLLPPPSPGDVFLDFESYPFHPDGVFLEYLIGWLGWTADGTAYRGKWSDDRVGEVAAVTAFLDDVNRRLTRHPDLHVYHYGDYERGALTRLAGRSPGTAADRIRALLDSSALVDLQRVVKGSIRVSQRKIGLKYLEPLYGFTRDEHTQSGGDSIVDYAAYVQAVQRGDAAAAERSRDQVIRYNQRDCESTAALTGWLRRVAARSRAA